MPHEKTVTVFTFDELSDAAKEKARDWYREGVFNESHDWDHIVEDAATVAALFGLTIGSRVYRTVGGKSGTEPAVYFSGFWNQGDGASFEGEYEFKADALAAVKAFAPTDAKLHDIVARLHAAQSISGPLSCRITQRGSYSHENTMLVDFYDYEGEAADNELGFAQQRVEESLKDFARWIYDGLKAEYEYQSADEQVDESIRANAYEFTDDGKRYY